MVNFFFRRESLTGFSAYLRNLELSVHRSTGGSITPLKDYCYARLRPPIEDVTSKLKAALIGAKAETHAAALTAVPARGPLATVSAWLQWYLRGGVIVDQDEIEFIEITLLSLLRVLNEESEARPKVLVPIRIRLLGAHETLLQCIPSRVIRRSIRRVEHFNANAILTTESVASIAGTEDWLHFGER
jgi:hypothetical protein